ncbi:MAG: class I tRNA ligase family protein, partial [Nanoarchaeota archaeon]
KYELHNALSEIWKFINEVNKHINEEKPWELKGKELEKHLYTLTEALRIIAILINPFIPETSNKINSQLGIKLGKLKDCKFGLIKKYKVKKSGILFKKV